ncbi:ATP-binding protein involved in chromosome partitioning [Ekhidna lutea]|uniref:Iron-sulfur cluster carrier protein n=1 Tax=Ekhidna lutea TaxID=447679 RepID=A0A239HZ40_EKHLU|nr:Mrp/NBP35 family ATP-binding protein [Ekhidna lutea]SNS86501.1 ATP-binding protein involved in chromosome partitioning [Ekhidna lutea]
MELTKENLLKALSEVIDPDLKKDLVSLGMIQNIHIDGDKAAFDVVLTTPACPLKEVIKKDCEEKIQKHLGEVKTIINMTSNVTTKRDEGPVLPGVKNIIAVSSGKGGVGKSTIAANLAVALARSGADVGLIDADIYGPSIPTMFNCEFEQPGIVQEDGKNKIVPIQQYGVKLISIGLLTNSEDAVVWRGPMASSALRQFISDAKWGELDYLVIDLPPGTSDIHLTLVQAVPVTGAVVVTTPQKVALADAQKGISMFKQPQINVPILGLVENMSWFTPEELPDNKYYIFGEGGGQKLAEKNEVELLGQIPIVQTIRESGDSGYPAAMKDGELSDAFMRLAENVARQVAIRNASQAETKKVEVTV